jgi:hypothetical protein
MMCTPRSRMNILNSQEIDKLVARSQLAAKYAQTIDRESAHEMLSRKIDSIQWSDRESKNGKQASSKPRNNTVQNEDYRQRNGTNGWQRPISAKKRRTQTRRRASNYISTPNNSTLGTVLNSATSKKVGRTAANAFTRGILGTLGLNTTRGTKSTNRKKIKQQNAIPNWF